MQWVIFTHRITDLMRDWKNVDIPDFSGDEIPGSRALPQIRNVPIFVRGARAVRVYPIIALREE